MHKTREELIRELHELWNQLTEDEKRLVWEERNRIIARRGEV